MTTGPKATADQPELRTSDTPFLLLDKIKHADCELIIAGIAT